MNAKKNILITHKDLDGCGCAIVFLTKFPNGIVEYHDYKTITERSKELLETKDEYSKIYFADISPEEEEGKLMLNDEKFIIIDHHTTREYLKGDFKNVVFDTEWSATKLFYDYLIHKDERNIFILSVDAWDSWKLDSDFRANGEELNLLCGYYGLEEFVKKFIDMQSISISEKTIIEVLRKQKEDYLQNKIKQAKIKLDEDGNKYWEFYIGEPQSGLGNMLEMIDDLPDIKYIKSININDNIVSLYSIEKLNFNVSELAKKKGGGGHPKASGYTIIN